MERMKSLSDRILFTLVLLLVNMSAYSQVDAPLKPIDQNRVKEISKLLEENPNGLGRPYSDRLYWDKLLNTGKFNDFLKSMDKFRFPTFKDDDYFSLSRGAASSANGLAMMRNRPVGLARAVWAECLENKGNYMKIIEDGLNSMLDQKSWVSPRNDENFINYNGKEYTVEITSALYAHTIAQTLYLLDNKLNPELKSKAISVLYERIFNPVLRMIENSQKKTKNNFLIMTNNYNAVCLSGVVGAALAVIKDKEERATFISIGEYYSMNGLMGFNNDGYCTEGLSYFNYGFSNFIVLRENIWQATQGKIDLFNYPKVSNIVKFPFKMEIINNTFPAISDCPIGTKPDVKIINYLECNNADQGIGTANDLMLSIIMNFPNSCTNNNYRYNELANESLQPHSYFEETILLVTRPGADSTHCDIGAVFKGGNNGEHHNHNDVGSYTIVKNNVIMVGDPGVIPYTSNIFNSKYRYTYKTISSYGHPVPLVAGTEQRAGLDAKAVLVEKKFDNMKDEILLDITSAYDVPSLQKLERLFEYDRSGKGTVKITDNYTYDKAELFETAIITRSKWEQTAYNKILLEQSGESMEIIISSDNDLNITSEVISEGGIPYTRISIATKTSSRTGYLSTLYQSK